MLLTTEIEIDNDGVFAQTLQSSCLSTIPREAPAHNMHEQKPPPGLAQQAKPDRGHIPLRLFSYEIEQEQPIEPPPRVLPPQFILREWPTLSCISAIRLLSSISAKGHWSCTSARRSSRFGRLFRVLDVQSSQHVRPGVKPVLVPDSPLNMYAPGVRSVLVPEGTARLDFPIVQK